MSSPVVIRASAALLAVAMSSACAYTRTTPFEVGVRHSQRTPVHAIRFYSAQPPNCPYEEVGRVTAESRLFVSWARVVAAARKAAHDLGGDAIIGVKDNSRLSASPLPTTDGGAVSETSTLSGIVIRFKEIDCMT